MQHLSNFSNLLSVLLIDNVCVNNAFPLGNNVYFERIESHFKGSYDKQHRTLVVISYEIYETRQRLVSYILFEMTTRVRSPVYPSA